MFHTKPSVFLACSLGLLICSGCPTESGSSYRELGKTDDVTNVDPLDHHHHDHGPHGGHILEFGKWHGEVVMGDDRTVTVYILGGDAETAAPLADATAVLHLHVGGEETEVPLTASPQEGDPENQTSRFVASADVIPESIDDIEKLHGEVVLTVAGETVTGEITHDHDHDHDHGHDHGDHDDDHDHEHE